MASFPWWVSVIAAIVVYGLLHEALPRVEFETPVFHGFARVGSTLAAPFACLLLLVAVVSVTKSWKRKQLFHEQEDINDIRKLSWQQFEQYIGEFYRSQGYQVEETGLGGADGGIDLVAKRGSETLLIQCKHWRSNKVGVPVVRELLGVVTAEKAAGGVLVATGRFTRDAHEFSQGQNIQLIDGKTLTKMIGLRDASISSLDSFESTAPACPKCHSTMVARTATKGSHEGEGFWGCSRYPSL